MDLQPHTVAVCGNNQSGTTDGSGIRAALWVGADMDADPTAMYFDRSGMVPSAEYANYIEKPITENAYLLMGSQPFLHVNIDGKRFGNEAVPYDFKVNAAGREPNKCFSDPRLGRELERGRRAVQHHRLLTHCKA